MLALIQVEAVTNHDVKAIEYVLKERFRDNEELNEVKTAFLCANHHLSPQQSDCTTLRTAFVFAINCYNCYDFA